MGGEACCPDPDCGARLRVAHVDGLKQCECCEFDIDGDAAYECATCEKLFCATCVEGLADEGSDVDLFDGPDDDDGGL